MLRFTLLMIALNAVALALPMSDLSLEEAPLEEASVQSVDHGALEDMQVRELIRHGNRVKWGWGNNVVGGLYKYSGTELLVEGTVQLASGVKNLFTSGICGVCTNGIAALFKTAISIGNSAACVPAATAVGALVAPILGGIDAGALGIATGIITQVKCSEAISLTASKLPWVSGDDAAFNQGFCTFTSLCDESDFKKPIDAEKILGQAKALDAKGKAAAEKVRADAEKNPAAKAKLERELQEARQVAEKKIAENKAAKSVGVGPAVVKPATTTAAAKSIGVGPAVVKPATTTAAAKSVGVGPAVVKPATTTAAAKRIG